MQDLMTIREASVWASDFLDKDDSSTFNGKDNESERSLSPQPLKLK